MTLYHPAPHARPLHPWRRRFPWRCGTRPESHRLADHCSSLHEPGDRAQSHGAFLRPSPATQPARSRAQTGRSTSTRSLGHLHVSAIALDLIAKRILEAVHFLARRAIDQIGRAHVCTPVTNAHLVCRLMLDTKKITKKTTLTTS